MYAKMNLAISRDQPGGDRQDENPRDDIPSEIEKSLLAKAFRQGLTPRSGEELYYRNDPTSPLYSIKSFSNMNLKDPLLKGIYGMGFDSPSKIQSMVIPILIADPFQNMIAQSQNGTGKTAAFVIAMIMRIQPELKFPQALCVAPTLELAEQIRDVIVAMTRRYMPEVTVYLGVRGSTIIRGMTVSDQIVVGTPGKLMDLILKWRYFDPKKIRFFVLDEADVMIDLQGHRDQSIRIYKTLDRETCQMALFSATYSNEVIDFAQSIISEDPLISRLEREDQCLANVDQYYVKCCSHETKYRAISNIYGVITIGAAIIFCRTRETVAWLASKMMEDGHAVAMLSGELDVGQRLAVLKGFRDGKEKVLISTNVLCRGIDIEHVTLIVNYDLPLDFKGNPDYDTYLHRIGRCGRFGKKGLSFNLVENQREQDLIQQIERFYGKKIKNLYEEDFPHFFGNIN